MKKFLVTLLLCFTVLFSVNAQKLMSNSMADGWFFSINGGAVTPQTEWIARPEAGVELGKWYNPVVALGISNEMQFNNTEDKTAIDVNDLSADLHISLVNWFTGYNTHWYDVEVIPSFVWRHYNSCQFGQNHQNFAGVRGSLRFIANFGREYQWQFFVQPGITYIDRPRAHRGFIDVKAGLLYRFRGQKTNSHTFAFIDEGIPQEQYDAVVAENSSLQVKLKAKPKEVVKEVVKEVNNQKLFFVTFALNDFELNDEAIEILNTIPKGSTVMIEGYASPDGSSNRNIELSEQRAEVVKYYLQNHGVTVRSAIGKGVNHVYHSNRLAVIHLVK